MADYTDEINNALLGDSPIPREEVLRWIGAAADISTLAKLYRLTEQDYYRIQPDLGREASCALIQRYLLQCIREGVPDSDEIMGRYEAAQSLLVWFHHLLEMKDTSPLLTNAASAVTDLFRTSEEDVQTAIETGFLEHVLETAALRPYFEHWSRDPDLKESWARASEWGMAHPDYTWGRLRQLRGIEEE